MKGTTRLFGHAISGILAGVMWLLIIAAVLAAMTPNRAHAQAVLNQGMYNSTLPTCTSGTKCDFQLESRGMLGTWISVPNTGAGVTSINGTVNDAASNTVQTYKFIVYPQVYNGGTWDNQRSVNGAGGAGVGTGVTAVGLYPASAANLAITPVVSAATESGHVLKASTGNLFRVSVTNTAAAVAYLMVFNASTVPADGAVTPQVCRTVPATGTVEVEFTYPQRYSTGISAALSSTGCFTKTASVNGFFEGEVE